MSVNKKFKNFSYNDLLLVASRFGIGEAKNIIDEMQEAIATWKTCAKEAGVSLSEINRIGKLHLTHIKSAQ